MHKVDPTTYPAADSWSHAQRNRDAAISVSTVVKRTFELFGRRRKGKALVFIIDEVGQHVARSGDKIEDLRATIEEFGKVGKNLVKERKIIAPCWIVVTSQEKLDEVVAAIDSKRVELAKLQDRFHYRVDLAPSDIREVATKRVLAKKTEAEKPLKKLFSENQGQLNAALRLERTSRRTDINESDFIHFYPYPPHYIDLCIGIMSGIRLQPGAPRHYGGSNRTIIKQAYEMLVSDRTAFAKKPIGALVTLDKVFELVEGNLSNEKRTDIHQISERFKNDAEDQGWALRVGKAICLLEFIRDLPRTEANLAAVLVDEVGKATPLSEVQSAVKRLHTAQFIRNTEEGWKLQTAQEKNWETERRGHLEPKPRERNELARTALGQIFDEPEFKTFRYQNRSFRVGISVDGTNIADEGELPLTLCVADDADELTKRIDEIRTESQQKSHENDLYWLFCLTPEIDQLVAQLHASRKMVDKYNQLSAQQKISPDEATCLQDEKNSKISYETRLRDKLAEAMERGTGMFRGVQKDASALGKVLGEILKKLFGQVLPDLYPKLQMGSRPLKGDEAEQILKAADLKALPNVFYVGDTGSGSSSRMARRTSSTPTPMSPRKCSITSRASTVTATKTAAWARRWRSDSAARLRLGTGHAAVDPGRLVPGWRDRGHVSRQPLPQLPGPSIPHAVHKQPGVPVVAVLAPAIGRPQDAHPGGAATRRLHRGGSRCRGRSHRRGVQEGGCGGTGKALPAQGHRRGSTACRSGAAVRIPANAHGDSVCRIR